MKNETQMKIDIKMFKIDLKTLRKNIRRRTEL